MSDRQFSILTWTLTIHFILLTVVLTIDVVLLSNELSEIKQAIAALKASQ